MLDESTLVNFFVVVYCTSNPQLDFLPVSRSIILPILIVVVVVVGCGKFTLKRFSGVHTSVWPSYVALGAVALADGLVAASMCWSLYLTDSIILTLMAYSINSGLLTGILGITATICFIILPTTMVWLAFSWAMSKCTFTIISGAEIVN
ncbi:hypothetical protein EDB84DRAFT_1542596 [Lactarius hengduanensis]|nr:hypothetical protein EDB84DRAFT_1542596 [Lactarius hengduanensis]